MSGILDGKTVAFLATDGFEQVELVQPWRVLEAAGCENRLLAPEGPRIQGMNHMDKADTFEVDQRVGEADPDDFDGLVLPGGVANPDNLRLSAEAVDFVRAFCALGRPLAAICHGPWVLVEAGVVERRTLTSWPSLATDIRNAGGSWVDKSVETDGYLITSRKPDDLDAFCDALVRQLTR